MSASLLRWLVLLLLVFDLGSSPLHAHGHAAGAQDLSTSAFAHSTQPTHSTDDHHSDGGRAEGEGTHLLAVLLPNADDIGSQPAAADSLHKPWSLQAVAPISADWVAAAVDRRGAQLPRHARPESRAPPTLPA